jgi:hypothetical protein
MAFTFDQVFAADPANPANIAQNAAITIFAPGDVTMTPLTITDPDGAPLTNPITVNANGFGSAFAHATLDRVAWAGGGFTGYFTSYEGIKNVAIAAQAAAEAAAATAGAEAAATVDAATASVIADAGAAAAAAAASATAAANSAALVGAPADTAVQTLVGSASATRTAIRAAVAGEVADTASATRTALNATIVSVGGANFARNATLFELVSNWVYGHSYTQGGFVPDNAKFHARVAKRLGTQPVTVNGVSGYKMQQAAIKAISTWTPGSRGLVMLTCLVNDVTQYTSAASGPATTAAALKAFLAMVSSGIFLAATTSPFAYSAGWTAGTTGITGRSAINTSTVGSYVDVTFTGDTASLSVNLSATGGGLITATQGGTTLGTLTTDGYYEATPGVLVISGLGAGSHTVRFTFTSGTAISIDGLYVRNPYPPTIAIYEEGWIPNFGVQTSAQNVRLTSTYPAALDPVIAGFSNVVKVAADSGWDTTTMVIADGIHPNELGHAYIAGRITPALLALPAREGQNVIVGAGFAYTGTTGGTATGLPAVPITDNFNRANSGTLGTTSDGRGTWTSVNMYVNANTAQGSGGGGDSLNWLETTWADVTLQATSKQALARGGLGGRFTDTSNFWLTRNVGGFWVIQKKVAGVISTPTGGTSTVAPALDDVAQLLFNGNTITLKINGTQVAQVTDTFNQTATKHGLFCPSGPDVAPIYDDFSATKIGP